MLRLALLFLVLAIVSSLFGFGLLASAFAGVAKFLFFLFLVLFLLFVVLGRRPPRPREQGGPGPG
jgi:uncharacterized membrane protein YtjA (UPF0391 family)